MSEVAGAAVLELLVAQFVDALAPRIADELAARMIPAESRASTAALVTLDQLVAELPPAKRPETWKRWLYDRLRGPGGVPGATKLGGNWFFDRDVTLTWARGGG